MNVIDIIKSRHGLPDAPEDQVATIEGWLHGLNALLDIERRYVDGQPYDADEADELVSARISWLQDAVEELSTSLKDIYVSLRTLQDDVMLGQMTRSDIAAWAASDADAIEKVLLKVDEDVPDMATEREEEGIEYETTDLGPQADDLRPHSPNARKE